MTDATLNVGATKRSDPRAEPRSDATSYVAAARRGLTVKRALDVAIVLVLSPVIAAVVAVAAFLIWREDRGRVLFTQRRIGVAGLPFTMYKLRTMRSSEGGAAFTAPGDDRITRVGRVLRRFRIDELPQVVNVLRGEMSIVGPRPEACELAREYARAIAGYHARHAARPGLTGWAQVNQGYAAGVDACREKLDLDLYYISNGSLWLDFRILFKTVSVLTNGEGAR